MHRVVNGYLVMECPLLDRLARAVVFDSSKVAVVRFMARTVQRFFLLGFENVTENDFDHRTVWIQGKSQQPSSTREFGVLMFLGNSFLLPILDALRSQIALQVHFC